MNTCSKYFDQKYQNGTCDYVVESWNRSIYRLWHKIINKCTAMIRLILLLFSTENLVGVLICYYSHWKQYIPSLWIWQGSVIRICVWSVDNNALLIRLLACLLHQSFLYSRCDSRFSFLINQWLYFSLIHWIVIILQLQERINQDFLRNQLGGDGCLRK